MADQKISARDLLTGTGVVSTPVARAGSTTDYRIVDNLSATTDPGVGDDSADGFHVGSRWFNTSAGRVWMCTDASAGAAVWTRQMVVDDNLAGLASTSTARSNLGLGSVANVGPMPAVLPAYGTSNIYLTMPFHTSAAGALTNNRMYFCLIEVPESRGFTSMAIQCTTGVASAQARVGVYNVSSARQPTTLIAEATTDGSGYPLDLSTTGTKTCSISQTLAPGVYAIVLIASGTASVSMATGGPNTLGSVITGATSIFASRGGFVASTFGALSGISSGDLSGTTFTMDSANIPIVGIR